MHLWRFQNEVRRLQDEVCRRSNLSKRFQDSHIFFRGDKVITGSFDKSAKIWDATTGQLLHTLKGHLTEIVCVVFNPQGTLVATGNHADVLQCRAVGQ